MTTSFDEMIQKTSQLIPWVIRPNLKHAALIKHLPNLITLYHDDTNNGAQRIWYKQTDQEIAAQQQQQQQQFNSSTNKLQTNVSRKRSRAEITPRTPRTRFRSPSIRTNLMNKPIVRKESRWTSERDRNGYCVEEEEPEESFHEELGFDFVLHLMEEEMFDGGRRLNMAASIISLHLQSCLATARKKLKEKNNRKNRKIETVMEQEQEKIIETKKKIKVKKKEKKKDKETKEKKNIDTKIILKKKSPTISIPKKKKFKKNSPSRATETKKKKVKKINKKKKSSIESKDKKKNVSPKMKDSMQPVGIDLKYILHDAGVEVEVDVAHSNDPKIILVNTKNIEKTNNNTQSIEEQVEKVEKIEENTKEAWHDPTSTIENLNDSINAADLLELTSDNNLLTTNSSTTSTSITTAFNNTPQEQQNTIIEEFTETKQKQQQQQQQLEDPFSSPSLASPTPLTTPRLQHVQSNSFLFSTVSKYKKDERCSAKCSW